MVGTMGSQNKFLVFWACPEERLLQTVAEGPQQHVFLVSAQDLSINLQ